MSKRFLTLDIGAANVALAEYECSGKGAPTLVNYGTSHLAAPIDSGDASTILSPAILEIVREKGIRPGPVAISVSGQMVFPRFAAIAAAGGDDKFEQMVRYEIEQNVPFPIDEMVFDRQVLGDTPNGDKSVMIVAAKTEQIESVTDAVASAGFRPEIVDVAPIALVNAVRASTGITDCVIILDIGAKTTSLIISEGENVYNRSIPIAGNTITKEVAQALGCTIEEAEQIKQAKGYVSLGGVAEDEDEVADRISKVCRTVLTRLQAEISRSVNFYRSQQGGGAPVQIFLTGGTALLPQIDEFFAEALQIEVGFYNPFDWVGVGPAVNAETIGADGAFLAPTVGLALHLSGQSHFSINLLPDSIRADRAERAKIPVIAIAGVALLGALTLMLLAANRNGKELSEASEAVSACLSDLRAFEKKAQGAQDQVNDAKANAERLRALVSSRYAAVSRLNALRGALMPGMWIERWDGGKVTVRGWKDKLTSDGKQTPSELVVSKLKGNPAVIPDSVKIAAMTEIGPIQQFVVELKFK